MPSNIFSENNFFAISVPIAISSRADVQFLVNSCGLQLVNCLGFLPRHGVQPRMISVVNFFVFLRLLFFAWLLLYVT